MLISIIHSVTWWNSLGLYRICTSINKDVWYQNSVMKYNFHFLSSFCFLSQFSFFFGFHCLRTLSSILIKNSQALSNTTIFISIRNPEGSDHSIDRNEIIMNTTLHWMVPSSCDVCQVPSIHMHSYKNEE